MSLQAEQEIFFKCAAKIPLWSRLQNLIQLEFHQHVGISS